MQTNAINSVGLVMDIAGAILLFKYGLPTDINRKGESALLLQKTDEEEIKKGKRYDKYSKVGIFLLIIGFVFQLVSNFTYIP